jgi:hypothetical protein
MFVKVSSGYNPDNKTLKSNSNLLYLRKGEPLERKLTFSLDLFVYSVLKAGLVFVFKLKRILVCWAHFKELVSIISLVKKKQVFLSTLV